MNERILNGTRWHPCAGLEETSIIATKGGVNACAVPVTSYLFKYCADRRPLDTGDGCRYSEGVIFPSDSSYARTIDFSVPILFFSYFAVLYILPDVCIFSSKIKPKRFERVKIDRLPFSASPGLSHSIKPLSHFDDAFHVPYSDTQISCNFFKQEVNFFKIPFRNGHLL